MITKPVLDFLVELTKNNNREWFTEHKKTFQANDALAKSFFNEVYAGMQKMDSIDKMQVLRIYRDVRFSKDKTPYKNYFSAWFPRTKPAFRGSYYLHLQPGESFIEGGFWEPNAADLMRIRKEFELDDSEIRNIIAASEFKKYFGELQGEGLKTAPKGFDKDHPAIDLIRKKQFLVVRKFTDKEVLDKNFKDEMLASFAAMRPFFDYMSDVLTTNLNGESLLE
ncbi:TIGR02453 family protein [Flavobacterium album]|uniref:TIGR02453 family protein n=1 Tax=Flavobacterium album TaxID=2175091 RepID=A0A2S1R342_9FLAO|nr:DUF2461 domain-containing protein [Flavobacterium album]AWH87006.1 TIGR02453 family protein [Flavobacterium album]